MEMECGRSCLIALCGVGLGVSLSGLRRVSRFKIWVPAWLPYLWVGLSLGLAGGTTLMRYLNYRI